MILHNNSDRESWQLTNYFSVDKPNCFLSPFSAMHVRDIEIHLSAQESTNMLQETRAPRLIVRDCNQRPRERLKRSSQLPHLCYPRLIFSALSFTFASGVATIVAGGRMSSAVEEAYTGSEAEPQPQLPANAISYYLPRS